MDPNGLLMDVNGMAHQCLSLGLPHQDGLFAGVQGPIRRTEVATSPVSPEGVAGGARLTEDELAEAIRYFVGLCTLPSKATLSPAPPPSRPSGSSATPSA